MIVGLYMYFNVIVSFKVLLVLVKLSLWKLWEISLEDLCWSSTVMKTLISRYQFINDMKYIKTLILQRPYMYIVFPLSTRFCIFLPGHGSYLCGAVSGGSLGLLRWVQQVGGENAVSRLPADPDHTGSPERHGRQKGKEYDTIFDLYIYLLSYVVFI